MKVFLFYLTLPSNLRKLKVSEECYDDFLEVSGCLKYLPKKYNSKGDKWIYLYAITDNKKYAEYFENMYDMNLFTRIKKEMEDDEWKIFKKENSLCLLECINFDTKKVGMCTNLKELICTRNEFNEISDSFDILFINKLAQTVYSAPDYSFLKQKYIDLLDSLLYCTYNRIYSENTPDIINENVQYNYSFGLTAEDNRAGDICCRPVELYLKIFSLLLKKGSDEQ